MRAMSSISPALAAARGRESSPSGERAWLMMPTSPSKSSLRAPSWMATSRSRGSSVSSSNQKGVSLLMLPNFESALSGKLAPGSNSAQTSGDATRSWLAMRKVPSRAGRIALLASSSVSLPGNGSKTSDLISRSSGNTERIPRPRPGCCSPLMTRSRARWICVGTLLTIHWFQSDSGLTRSRSTGTSKCPCTKKRRPECSSVGR